MSELYRMLAFRELGDERGNLIAIEGGQDIPFEIQRIFYMYGTDETMVRGQHANRNSQFVLVNVSGASTIRVCDGLGQEAEVRLDQPRTAIYIPRMIWKEMKDFSRDSVILCLTDTHYDPDEYIRDYEVYKQEMQKLVK
ncbi:MAG: FdtA/QdtA family cupin domain-containing protein [Solobacterium sp.]|nr:FdtA/QdtA family cupin domain-containing protein [Solobacterium sp.]